MPRILYPRILPSRNSAKHQGGTSFAWVIEKFQIKHRTYNKECFQKDDNPAQTGKVQPPRGGFGKHVCLVRVQRCALRIILKKNYESYEDALKLCNLDSSEKQPVTLICHKMDKEWKC